MPPSYFLSNKGHPHPGLVVMNALTLIILLTTIYTIRFIDYRPQTYKVKSRQSYHQPQVHLAPCDGTAGVNAEQYLALKDNSDQVNIVAVYVSRSVASVQPSGVSPQTQTMHSRGSFVGYAPHLSQERMAVLPLVQRWGAHA